MTPPEERQDEKLNGSNHTSTSGIHTTRTTHSEDTDGFNQWEGVLTGICTVSLAIGFFGGLLNLFGDQAETIFYIIAYLSGGYIGTRESIRDLRKYQLNVDFLMVVAAIGAATIGDWLEGATLLFLFSLSNTLQGYAMGRSRKAIRSLMKLRPNEALVRRDHEQVMVPVEELELDDVVIVKPGERIPIDGKIIKGQTSVNQSAITGESIPVTKVEGDEVFAATMNENGAIEVKVTRLAQDTTLAKIIQMVERAQARKATTQRFLENFESKYATSVIFATVLLILIPWWGFGQNFDFVFYRAMTVLVVASPCALIISTPAAILSAIANAARNGILFKGGAYLEQAANISAIAFDKTGTLTTGKPVVTDIITAFELIDEQKAFQRDDVRKPHEATENEVLRAAASSEEHSEHHLGAAIVDKARERNLELLSVENLQAITGKGISAHLNGDVIRVGNKKLFEKDLSNWPESIIKEAERLEGDGKTVVFIGKYDRPMGLIALADEIREQAPGMINQLKQIGIQRLIMLTGDAKKVASSVANQLGIKEFFAELLPDEKVDIIEKISDEEPVAMVGDGVNDAPALAASHMGVAMGAAGTDVALETADVVLMSDDLNKLPYVIQLSRRARKVVWQNIIFSLSVIAILVASVFLFQLPLPLGVVGHEGSTLIVVLNGLRLLKTHKL